MPIRAYWQFYKSIFPFVVGFSLIGIVYLGLIWGFVFFATVSLFFGFYGFRIFYNKQFYFYYNLGLTKTKLFLASFVINLLIGLPVFSIFIVIFHLVFGNFSIT